MVRFAGNLDMSHHSYVYILTNMTKTVLYIGVTSNLHRRMDEHKNKKGSAFAIKYNLDLLIYYEIFDDIYSAILREKSLKGKTRKKKEDLIISLNPSWKDLSYELG